MKILICVKAIRDRSNGIAEEYELNKNDENLIEVALSMREKYPDIYITVLSLGPKSALKILQEIYSYHIDNIVLVTDSSYAGSDTLATSFVLEKAIRHLGYFDLILCGCYSSDGNTGQVAPELAERLELPYISNITSLEVNESSVQCWRIIDNGRQIVEAKLPILLSFVKGINNLRIPCIRDILLADSKNISIFTNDLLDLDLNKCGLCGSATKVKQIQQVVHRQKGEVMTVGDDYVHKILMKILEN